MSHTVRSIPATGAILATLSMLLPAVLGQSPPPTPFRQCPPVGASNSCGVLIVINPNNTVSVYTDSKVPPYENSEDTLTGVLNNSGRTITSLPLKSGTDIFGFEDDGICSDSISPKPGGCPFGPTGYEGPGVSFSNISSDKGSGTVSFSSGIPPGGTSYFGLEEALTAADVTVPLNTTCPSDATIGSTYSSQLSGTGGNGNYSWSLVAQGSLGAFTLSVSPSGLVTGTPDTVGQLNFTIKISDTAGATAQQACTITVTAVADLMITRVEAVQVIHGSDVPLIAGKPTVVRVFVRAAGQNVKPVANVSAILHGPSAPDPLQPFTPPITAQVYSGPLPFNNPPNYEEQTIDFLLPDDWVNTSGVFSLEADLVLPPNYKDPDTSNNTGMLNLILFTPPSNPASLTPGNLRVGYVSICLQAPGTQKKCPSASAGTLTQFVNKLYPVTPGGFQFYRAARLRNPYSKPIPNTNAHNEQDGWGNDLLVALRNYFGRSTFYLDMDFLIGFLPDVPGIPFGGLADALWAGGEGEVALVVDYTATTPGYTAEALAHELGHNIGLRHTNQNMPNARPFACTQVALDSCTTWPYPDPTIQNAGYDVPNRKVVPAKTNFDMMSYCADYTASEIWISPDYYGRLFTNNLAPSQSPENSSCSDLGLFTVLQRPQSPASQGGGSRGRRALSAAPQNYLQVSGTAARDGSSGQLNPAFRINTRLAPKPSDPNGNYCLFLSSNSGTSGTYCFRLNFLDIESGSLLDQASFSFLVAAPQDVSRIALLSGTRELASISAGAQPPTLTITTPRAGDTWNAANTQNLVWSGSGSAALTYIVDYSSDGGTTWMPLSTEMTDSSLSIDPSEIAGGSNVFFRVQASDGLNTTPAQVGPITIVQTAAIAASQVSVDFRNALPGQGVLRQLVLTNSGTGPLQVTGASTTDTSFKVLSPAIPFTIQTGDTAVLTLQFSPLLIGQKVATLMIASNSAGNSILSISLRGNGIATTAPDAAMSSNSINFGAVPVGASKTQGVTLQNFGPAPLQVISVSVTGAGFTATGAAAGLTLSANAANAINVQFAPSQPGAFTGSLVIVSNDPKSPTTVTLGGTGAAPAAPAIRVNPTSLDFGSVATGQTKSLTLTVQNAGTAALTISSISSNNPRFTVTSPSLPNQVAAGSQQQVTVQFAPNASGVQSGTLTIASNDPGTPSLAAALTGTGAASQPSTVVLQVDGGAFDQVLGFVDGQAGAAFVNRLTPAHYPATLQNVQIYFGNRTDGLPQNTPIRVVFGASPSGSPSFSTTFTVVQAKVGARDTFNVFPITPLTITSGDFIVGFVVDNPPGIYPADVDTLTASMQRSYFAAGNFTFALLDSVGLAGNLGIRATVTQ